MAVPIKLKVYSNKVFKFDWFRPALPHITDYTIVYILNICLMIQGLTSKKFFLEAFNSSCIT